MGEIIQLTGLPGAGKTTLADDLAEYILAAGSPVVRSSIDHFHHPRAFRYRRGADSPEGYYQDSFDLPALRRVLLDPLAPGGSRVIQTALFDFRSDSPISPENVQVGDESIGYQAEANVILIFDGVFLLRPELEGVWDFTIFLQIDFQTILARAMQRDVSLLGSPAAVRLRYLNRYLPAQQMYLSRSRPDLRANVVIDNNNPIDPVIRRFQLPPLDTGTH